MTTQKYDTLFAAIRQKCQFEHWYGPDMEDPAWWDKYDMHGRVENALSPVKKQPDHPQRIGFAFPPASEAQVQATEAALGFPLPPLLRALYTQVANGGFGPFYGLIGVRDGQPGTGMATLEGFYPHAPEPCRIISLAECIADIESSAGSEQPHLVVPHGTWPDRLLMFCEYGCCIYFHVDVATEHVFESYVSEDDHSVVTAVAPSLEEWLLRWTRYEKLTSWVG